MNNILVVGGDLDGQRLSDDKSPSNPVCTSGWCYTRRVMSIEREGGSKEEFVIFCPDLWSRGDVIKQLILGYRKP